MVTNVRVVGLLESSNTVRSSHVNVQLIIIFTTVDICVVCLILVLNSDIICHVMLPTQ